jgi:hypothetical protein
MKPGDTQLVQLLPLHRPLPKGWRLGQPKKVVMRANHHAVIIERPVRSSRRLSRG